MRSIIIAFVVLCAACSYARTYSMKVVGSSGTGGQMGRMFQDLSKRTVVELKIGAKAPKDSDSPIEIRAATVFKSVQTRKPFINDVTTYMVNSTNVTQTVLIESGVAWCTRDKATMIIGDMSTGNALAGVVVEIWQDKKFIKRLTNIAGYGMKIDISCEPALYNKDGQRASSVDSFDNGTSAYLKKK